MIEFSTCDWSGQLCFLCANLQSYWSGLKNCNKSFLFLFLYSLFFARMDVFMPLVINVIHYNSSFLDEDIITGIVRWALKKHCSQCDLYTESSFTAHMYSHKAIALVPQTMATIIVSRSLSARAVHLCKNVEKCST